MLDPKPKQPLKVAASFNYKSQNVTAYVLIAFLYKVFIIFFLNLRADFNGRLRVTTSSRKIKKFRISTKRLSSEVQPL